MMKEETMTPMDEEKLFLIRCMCKQGRSLNDKEQKFLNECYAKYPQQYAALTPKVFKATAPFGSRA